jgi:hypothetical protein
VFLIIATRPFLSASYTMYMHIKRAAAAIRMQREKNKELCVPDLCASILLPIYYNVSSCMCVCFFGVIRSVIWGCRSLEQRTLFVWQRENLIISGCRRNHAHFIGVLISLLVQSALLLKLWPALDIYLEKGFVEKTTYEYKLEKNVCPYVLTCEPVIK